MKPVRTMITFVPVETENKSAGGIIAPTEFKSGNGPDATTVKAAMRAKVVAVGPGKMTPAGWRNVCCAVGDYIQLTPNAYLMSFTLNGVTTFMVDDEHIVGILDEEDVVQQIKPEPEKKVVPVSKLVLQ